MGREPPRGDLLPQGAARGLRLRPELPREEFLETRLLRKGLGLPSPKGIQPHQAYVRLLASRLLDDDPPQCLNAGSILPALLVEARELDQQRQEQLPQTLAGDLRPLLVRVFRQELPGVQVQGRPVGRWLTGASRRRCRLLESLDVQPQISPWAQHELLTLRSYVAGGGLGVVGPEGAAGGMEDLAEAVGGRVPPVVRPEEVHSPLPVEVVPRREREQLH